MSTKKVASALALVLAACDLTVLPQSPAAAAAVPAGTYVYVANGADSTVSVFNTAAPTGPVPGSPVTVDKGTFGLAATPDGSEIYVGSSSNAVSVIDAATNAVTATVPVGTMPNGLAVAPDAGHVYVANNSSGTVSVIGTATNAVTATIPVGNNPFGVAVTPDSRHVYVADNTAGKVSVIDTATNAVSATVTVDHAPLGVAVTPDGTKAYVTNGIGTVSVIDTATNAVTTTIHVGSRPFQVAVAPDGIHAYVTNLGSNSVSVIDTATNTVTSTISVGSDPYGVAVAPDDGHVYVTNEVSNTVSVIDTATNTVTATVPVGGDPLGVAIGGVLGTPYLDQIEAKVKQASPGLEHVAWERTHGNLLDDSAGDWLLQTPQCWGTNPCPLAQRTGTTRLLKKITDNIAEATSTVDMTSLGCPDFGIVGVFSPCASFPDGAFRAAIVAGLKTASARPAARNRPITFRLLMGAPALKTSSQGNTWIAGLQHDIGSTSNNIVFVVGVMTTSYAGYPLTPIGGYTPSWNHSKLIVVDGKTLIEGGVNTYTNNYVDTPKPVTDMMMAVKGPAAGSATKYINKLWGWTCAHRLVITGDTGAWVYSSPRNLCISDLTPPAAPEAGDTDMLEVGGLGVGIQAKDDTSHYQLSTLKNPDDAKCQLSFADRDVVNFDRDYQTVNPEETALRAMVASATKSIVFSQQDLYGWCATVSGPIKALQPLGDLRLLDNLATKMIQGVKVRIVISTPGNEDSYSTIQNMAQFSDLLRKRIALQQGNDAVKAEQVMIKTLQYASLRSSDQPRWLGDDPSASGINCNDLSNACTYAQHTKLIVVDDRVFYLGSKNAYPAFLQDDGYFVEDPNAVAHINQVFLNPQWEYSKADATYDPQTPKPPTVLSLGAVPGAPGRPAQVSLLAVTRSGAGYTVQYAGRNGEKLSCKASSGTVCRFAQVPGAQLEVVDDTTNMETVIDVPHS